MKSLLVILVQLSIAYLAIGQTYPVTWANHVNTSASSNTLTKTASNGWNAGASSTNTLGANANGFVEITIAQTNTHRFFGLSNMDESIHYRDIDYAIFLLSNQTIRIYEGGSYKGSYGNYATGDKIRVERTNGQIMYKKNGSTLYTSESTSATSLVVDATLYHEGGTIENAIASFSDSESSCTDVDNDGVCAANDCNDNDATFPKASGTACNDNNANTENDQIQSDGCTCQGTMVDTGDTGGGGTDGGGTDDGETDGGTTTSLWTSLTNHINYEGKVVIGPAATATPGDYNLYVTKGVLAERVRVALTTGEWADYVFSADYVLNDPTYVEAYIKEHQHLPNVPSAQEVGKEGIDLGKMNATLLRQIEELWLHTITLNKRVEQLEKELTGNNE